MMSGRTTMNVSLPEPMREWVEARVNTGEFANASDYVRDLIRHDQDKVKKIAHMQQLVDEAREGGLSSLSMEDIRKGAQKQAGLDL